MKLQQQAIDDLKKEINMEGTIAENREYEAEKIDLKEIKGFLINDIEELVKKIEATKIVYNYIENHPEVFNLNL